MLNDCPISISHCLQAVVIDKGDFMEIMDIAAILIVGIAVLAISLIFRGDILSAGRGNISSNTEGAILFTSGPLAAVTFAELSPQITGTNDVKYKYDIEIPIKVAYSGQLDEYETEIGIISIIEFKGKTAKAEAAGFGDYFIIQKTVDGRPNPQWPNADVNLKASLISGIPPLKQYSQGMYMIAGQKVYIDTSSGTSGGKYLIGVTKFFHKAIETITKFVSPPCWVKFSIESEKDLKQIDLTKCIRGTCEQTVSFGNGNVKISINDIEDCEKVYPTITAKNGEAWKKEPNDMLAISFWKLTACTTQHDTFETLKLYCINSFENSYLGRTDIEIKYLSPM